MRAMHLRLGTFCFAVVLPLSLAAQAAVTVPRGTPIRAYMNRLPSEVETTSLPRVTGSLAAFARDTIFLVSGATSDTAWLPLRNIDHIEYSTGQYHPIAKASFLGALLGLGGGITAGFIRNSTPHCDQCTVGNLDGGLGKTQYALVGTAIGLVGGFVSGALLTVERWHRADPAIFAVRR